ncbi:pyrroline-5-carboxylate reductase [Gymnopus androsaceus JB14]|uniref:Pyrroline-5-carboxylate reductase n=1 Tax=Gymnopus androsaceus JB14 TaxID=1447944 RepID=A0A6A4HP17_9AGAR|nr:pyrroline-5-carboxylate reductase [Gymnopus androsaceus JB14]
MGYTLSVLGCGTMGIAVLSGVVDSLDIPSRLSNGNREKWESHTPGTLTPTGSPDDKTVPSRFIACVKREESAVKLKGIFASMGVMGQNIEVVVSHNVQAVQESDVVLLCCKPQIAHSTLSEPRMKEALNQKLLISTPAGVTISQLSSWVLPSIKMIRAMPNTPCKIREGMTVLITSSLTEKIDSAIILKIFSSIGRCRILDEKHFDACTALSSSSPAFACIFLEAMADGGVMIGLPRAEALELASQTLQGAARMVLQAGQHPAQIRDAVATPGGCTIAGLLALEDGKVRSTIARCIPIATDRASELGQPNTKNCVADQLNLGGPKPLYVGILQSLSGDILHTWMLC